MHTANLVRLSTRRVLVLAEAGGGRYRLWQLVRRERTLRDRIEEAMAEADALQLVADLASTSAHLVRARELLHTPRLPLPCTLRTIGSDMARDPVFVGIVPENADDDRADEPEGAALVDREIGPLLRELARDRGDYDEIVDEIVRRAETDATRPGLRTLAALAMAPR